MSFGFGFSLPAYTGYGSRFGAGSTLLLDFTSGNQTLDPRITFTRTTTATRTNSSGVIDSVSINGPRFDYNPTTLAPNGLLIEEQRTNLLLQSADFTTTWSQVNITTTANTTASPDGATNGDTLLTNSAGALCGQTSQPFTAGSTITFSVFAKKNASNFVRVELGNLCSCWWNLNTGAVASNNAGSGNVLFSAKSIQAISGGWYRCVLTVTTSTITTLGVSLFATNTDSNSSSLNSSTFLWGAQIEVGAFPTSYIPTTTAAATRTADNATMTGTNFSSWYNATEGTMYASYSIPFGSSASAFPISTAIADGTFSNAIVSFERTIDDTQRSAVRVGGVAQTDLTSGGTYVYGTTAKQANAYKVNDFAMSANGAAVGVDTSGTVPVVDRMGLGGPLATGGALSYLNGTIKQIVYYPRRLTNAELQAITS